MPETFTIRTTTAGDLAAVDALLSVSYPALLKADYPPSVLVTALPIICRANPRLLASGSYYLAEDAAGTVLAIGGWTRAAPLGGTGPEGLAHIRHVATHPGHLRKGIAKALMGHAMEAARASGILQLDCLSTRTAVPFYAAMGFAVQGETNVPLRPGIDFPAIAMSRAL